MTEEYNFQEIEKKWQKKWADDGLFEVSGDAPDKKNKYVLVMFPYPSSDGLHVGHVEGYTAADIIARYYRMRGKNVLHPMGWDAFGLPAENYAIKKRQHPKVTTESNIANFRRQLESLGLSYTWSHEVDTSAPEYYHWTQWLFLQLYNKGLAYRKKAKVNWCGSCQTVLANEQVVAGHCERCHHQVIQKDLEQWFFRVTKYADDLLNGLEKIDWPEHIKLMQRNWIGCSEGAELEFRIDGQEDSIKVFTTRPDTLYGATYLVLAPEHALVRNLESKITNYEEVSHYIEGAAKKTNLERAELAKEKTGVELKGVMAVNPATGKKIPIWVADYVLSDYGHGAIMAVPAHDERDFEFASKFALPIIEVVSPDGKPHEPSEAYVGDGKLLNSAEFDGKDSREAGTSITNKVGGHIATTYRLRDWLVSRQRYWGAPIPIIDCENCGTVPVPENDLPVRLPDDVDFKPTGESPLERSDSFHNVKCPKCGGEARRESDTMDTFVDSSWYFLRYADPRNSTEIFDKEIVKRWLPVDIYIGGAEHAVLHLLYARFITKFLRDEKLIDFDEPFTKLRNQGLILGPDGNKMSKSRGNVINPDEIVDNYGADTLRLYEMFLGPLEQVKPWDTKGMEGAFRFLKRVYRLFGAGGFDDGEMHTPTQALINVVSSKIGLYHFNTVISSMMEYVNWCVANKSTLTKADAQNFIKLLSPFAPHITEELWTRVGGEGFVSNAPWPEVKENVASEFVTIPVQVNGKVRATIEVGAKLSKDEVDKMARDALGSRGINIDKDAKVVYVPGRVLNLVTKQV